MSENNLTPIEVDLSDVSSFDPVPPDIYRVAIVSVKNQRKSANNPANTCWDLVLQILEGEYAKRKVFHTLTVGPTCAGFYVAFAEAFDIPRSTGPTSVVDPTQWSGKIGYVELNVDSYTSSKTGETRKTNKVASYVKRGTN